MAIFYKNFRFQIRNFGPIFLLYFLSITETNTQFMEPFEIVSFNLQLIVIYYWMIKEPSVLGSSHIFFAGIINDVMMGLPMCTSSISYLTISFVASYVRTVTVTQTLISDCFTFLIAIFFSNLVYLILINNFSELEIIYASLFYNSFFTFLIYPLFWLFFNQYRTLMLYKKHE